MRFQTELVPGVLTRRYKRFLADVVLPDGREVVAHCPNPGAMTGLAEPGTTVWLEPNDDPRKKLKFGWRLTELPGGFACIDTGIANRVVAEALTARQIPALAGYETFRPEVKYDEGSRVDFLLSGGGPDLWLEVKSVTLRRSGTLAEFPDTKTARGAKHLGALARRAAAGDRAMVLYMVMRTDCTEMAVAADIDPGYAAARDIARGVETLCHAAHITGKSVELGQQLPVL
ncbi:MAG: DNA/RNA nuclease SfsA [Pseudomonadota bacterium]